MGAVVGKSAGRGLGGAVGASVPSGRHAAWCVSVDVSLVVGRPSSARWLGRGRRAGLLMGWRRWDWGLGLWRSGSTGTGDRVELSEGAVGVSGLAARRGGRTTAGDTGRFPARRWPWSWWGLAELLVDELLIGRGRRRRLRVPVAQSRLTCVVHTPGVSLAADALSRLLTSGDCGGSSAAPPLTGARSCWSSVSMSDEVGESTASGSGPAWPPVRVLAEF